MKKQVAVFIAISIILCAMIPSQAMVDKGVDAPSFLMRYIYLVNDMQLTISDSDPIFSPNAPKTGKPGITYDKFHIQVDPDTMQVPAAWFLFTPTDTETTMRLVAFMYALKEDVMSLDAKKATGNGYMTDATNSTLQAAVDAREDSPLDWGDYYICTVPGSTVTVAAFLK
jgi:hypothetical protein